MSSPASDRGRRPLLVAALLVVAAAATALVTLDPLHLHRADEWLRGETPPGADGSLDGSLWTCGMHPEVIQDHPGICPICQMELTPLQETGEAPAENALWTCPMHAEVIREEPGSCPICGMDLVPVAEAEGGHGADRAATGWTCRLHPVIEEEAPGECPICGLPLEPSSPGVGRRAPAQAGTGSPVVALEPGVVQKMNVTTAPVVRQDLVRRVRTVGSLDYDQERMVTVTTRYAGFVERSHVDSVGQPVRAGQPLFEVYAPDLVQTQRELLAAAAYAGELDGAPPDARNRAARLVEAARTRLSYWQIPPEQVAEIERSGEVLPTLTVRAPASGVVMKLAHGLEGMAVQPGMDVVHIADLGRLLLTVEIYEDQLAWIREGATAAATFEALPGREVTARVRYLEPEVNPTTRTVRLVLEVPNPDRALRVGMYATVTFEPVAVREAVVVPAQAVIRTGQRDLVVVALGGGRFQPREVGVGLESDGLLEVRSGLEEGETIVTSAQFLIDSESNLQAAIQRMIAARRR